jgi:hypothetical protein
MLKHNLRLLVFLLPAIMPTQAWAWHPAWHSAREVLIYYANENDPDEAELANYRTIGGWLRETKDKKLVQLADSFDRDMKLFPAAVRAEREVFRRRLAQWPDGPGAAMLTNAAVRRGKFWVFRPGADDFEEVSCRVPRNENFILASNPLCDPQGFLACLSEVARHFDPAEHEFVLVTKSHGNPAMAMTPRVAGMGRVAAGETHEATRRGDRTADGRG